MAAQEAPAASGWAGTYFGLGYGFQYSPGELRVPAGVASFDAGIANGKVGSDGFALLGHNWVSGNIVYGVEGEFGVHETKDMASLPRRSTAPIISGMSRSRGALGYDLGDFLPFVTLGATL